MLHAPRVRRAPGGLKIRSEPCWRIHHRAHQRYAMLQRSPKSTESVEFATAPDALWRDVPLEHRTTVFPFGVPVGVESNAAHVIELIEQNFGERSGLGHPSESQSSDHADPIRLRLVLEPARIPHAET